MKAEIIKRIRGFIRTQRYIGANEKLAVMRKRYSKTADEFYKEYGGIYYVNENGQGIGLNIKSTWHFVTLEEKIASLQSQLEKEREILSGLVRDFKEVISDNDIEPQRAGYLIEAENLTQNKEDES